jgi:CRP/FNR family transcriptional regulator, cyclic AMP receptor protein
MTHPESQLGSESIPNRQEIRDVISRALPDMHPATIDVLTRTARLRHVAGDATIYRQGDPVPLTILLSGYSAFRRTTAAGQELMSGVGRPGDLFGFSGLAAVQSSVQLVSLTDCTVAQWSGPDVRALARDDPGLALGALDATAVALHLLMERIDGFLHQGARVRVMRILVRHQDLFFGEPVILTRSHLPSLVGTSREMTGRVLRELEREGTLARVGRVGLKLLRPERLVGDAA